MNIDGADDRMAFGAGSRLRSVLALATLAMVGLSWPLWVERSEFPRVPFLASLPGFPPSIAWGVFAGLIVTLIATAGGIAWRISLSMAIGLLLLLVLQDQERFQPWVYQFGVLGLVLVLAPGATGLRLVRWWFIGVYLHSGLSKLDISFVNELGSLFLQTAMRPLRLDSQAWSNQARVAAILAMPAAEIIVAILLAIPKTRLVGMGGAMLVHLTLLGILGPFGLNHSTIVLVWNTAMLAEVYLVFRPDLRRLGLETSTRKVPTRLAAGLLIIVLTLPFGERWGWVDTWPAHALYASHVERTEVYLHESEVALWPKSIRDHVLPSLLGEWRRLDLTGWSRELRGVPIYPQGRACNGLAEALAARYGGRRLIRVIRWGPADRWTGARSRTEMFGLAAIRSEGDRYLLNAHPAGSFLRDGGGDNEAGHVP
ncbi:hypothetical protein [Singulisphaera sp. PoT]|uniref:hypothetical protein n=1 Tax=Singulisphaera sp. PoT TaxID=3411797 RepID=UPI003BF46B81